MEDEHISEHLSGHYTDDFEDSLGHSPAKDHKKPDPKGGLIGRPTESFRDFKDLTEKQSDSVKDLSGSSPSKGKKPMMKPENKALNLIEEEDIEKPGQSINLFNKKQGNLEFSKPKMNFLNKKTQEKEKNLFSPEETPTLKNQEEEISTFELKKPERKNPRLDIEDDKEENRGFGSRLKEKNRGFDKEKDEDFDWKTKGKNEDFDWKSKEKNEDFDWKSKGKNEDFEWKSKQEFIDPEMKLKEDPEIKLKEKTGDFDWETEETSLKSRQKTPDFNLKDRQEKNRFLDDSQEKKKPFLEKSQEKNRFLDKSQEINRFLDKSQEKNPFPENPEENKPFLNKSQDKNRFLDKSEEKNRFFDESQEKKNQFIEKPQEKKNEFLNESQEKNRFLDIKSQEKSSGKMNLNMKSHEKSGELNINTKSQQEKTEDFDKSEKPQDFKEDQQEMILETQRKANLLKSQNQRFLDTENQSSLETLFMRFNEFCHKNRENFAEICSKEEDNLFYYDDGLKKASKSGITLKTRSKYETKRKNYRGFMDFDAFQKILKSFEFPYEINELKSLFEVLEIIEKKTERIYYAKLIREMYRKKPQFNINTRKFQAIQRKSLDLLRKPEEALTLIKKSFKNYKEFKKKKEIKEVKKLEKLTEIQANYAEILQNPEKTLDFIREKVLNSQVSLDKIFQAFDKNNDGKISKEEFLLAIQQTGIEFKPDLINKVFEKLDIQRKGVISYMEFLANIYNKEEKASFFDYLNEAEHILEDLRLKVHERFQEKLEFINVSQKAFINGEKVSAEEFLKFIQNFTDRYSRIQLFKLFEYLDKNAKKFLNSDEFNEIYEHQLIKKPINKESPLKKPKEKEIPKEFEKITARSKNQDIQMKPNNKGIWGDREIKEEFRTIEDQKIIDVFTGGKFEKKTKKEMDEREKMMEMEIVLKDLSEKTKEILHMQEKNLRDLFNMFSKDFFGYVNKYEYERLMEFIWKDDEINTKAMNEIFKIYANQITKRMGFNMFLYMINLGDKINPIYLKFKFRFGNSLENIKAKLYEEFQKLDAKKGTGLLNITHFEKILKTNDITLSQKDKKYLADEGFLLIKSSTETYLNYRRLLPTIFPQTDQITQEMMRRAIKTIIRLRTYFKKRKERLLLEKKEAQQEKLSQSQLKKQRKIASFKGDLEKLDNKSKDKEEALKTSVMKENLQTIGLSLKPHKEIFEFEAEDHSKSPSPAQKTSLLISKPQKAGNLKKTDKNELLKSTLKGQMVDSLPLIAKEDPILKENRQKMLEFIRKLLDSCVKSAVESGESLLLTKEIQRKFEKRPVLKDVIICMQDFECEVLDILPRSLHISTDLARIIQVSKDNLLQEIDISNGIHLANLNLGSQIPLKSSKMLDIAFNSTDNRLYCLTDKWILEIWELHQRNSGPLNRIRVLPYKSNYHEIIERAYNNKTYAGNFPQFLIFSNNKPREIIINCSAINNSLVFFDPVSMSISKQMFLNLTDFRVSKKLAKNIAKIAEKLQEIKKSGATFEEIFKIPKQNNIIPHVSLEIFHSFLKKTFPQITNIEDIKEIANFLNQKNDSAISKDEFEYFFELPKILNLRSEKPSKIDNSSNNEEFEAFPRGPPIEMTEKSLKILYRMMDFFKKAKLAPLEAFKIFDSNDSGFISIHEFNKILDQISGYSASEEDKIELIALFDKDRNGTIEYNEFMSVYSQLLPDHMNKPISQLLSLQSNPRSNLLYLFQKSFDAGIDIEAELMKLDEGFEGNLQYEAFRNFLRWLPMGLLDNEIEEILEKEVVFCENARINYLSILQNSSFQQMKLRYQAKKSLINNKEFAKLMEELDSQENIYQNSQKVVIESLIYLSSLELIIYTTAFPLSSIIYVSTSAKRFFEKTKESNLKEKKNTISKESLFENILLARLCGHKSSYPPTIYYCEYSGCLISGEKLEKPRNQKNPDLLTSNNQSFLPFYSNIETSKDLYADILIWNLQRDLFENYQIDPPWSISPSKVISQAHYDSILDIGYLPSSQLLVTSSLDRTIKIWDPIAKPYPLNCNENLAYIRLKPGYYKKPDIEWTRTNEAFCEVKRIYTGDLVCHKIADFLQIVPVNLPENMVSEANNTDFMRKACKFEMLIVLELGRLQMIGNGYKRSGKLRGFFLERLQIEIEARCHDDQLPERVLQDLEALFIERKRKAKVSLQNHLPLLLENAKSRVVLQNKTLRKIQGQLKRLSLEKFQQKSRNEGLIQEIFQEFMLLPLRPKFQQKEGIDAAELYYYLRKFHCLHPFSLSKDQFIDFVAGLKQKARNILTDFDPFVKRTALEMRLFNLILHEKLEIRDIFNGESLISKEKLEKGLEIAKIPFTKEEFIEFWGKIDPFLSGSIKKDAFIDVFNEAILELNLRRHAKPQEIISKIMKSLKKDQRLALCMKISLQDKLNCGYLRKEEFLQAFKDIDSNFNKAEIEQLFDFYAEIFSEKDQEKVLNIAFFFKKVMSSNENFMLVQIFRTLGLIKSNLLAKGLPFDYLFRDNKDPLRIEDSLIQKAILSEEFEEKVMNLRISEISEKELKRLSNFLKMAAKDNKSYIGLDVFLHYLRKTQTKAVFINSPDDLKTLNREILAFLGKESEIREFASKKLSNLGDIRYLLIRGDIANQAIDELLVRFEEEAFPIEFEAFLNKLREITRNFEDFMKEEHEILSMSIKNPENMGVSNENIEKSPMKNKEKPTLKNIKEQFTVIDLFKEKSDKNVNRRSMIKSFKHTENLVNFIRTKAGQPLIRELLQFCRKFDEKHEGILTFSAFVNILKVIVDNLPSDMLISFSNEWSFYHKDSSQIDYEDFFNKYLQDHNKNDIFDENLEIPAWKEIDLNQVYLKIERETANANINLNYALKFFDREQKKVLLLKDFRELLAWLKVSLSEIELQALVFDLKKDSDPSLFSKPLEQEEKHEYLIDSELFIKKLRICNQGVSVVFNEKIWLQGLEFLQIRLIEVCYKNVDFLRFLFQQKNKKSLEDPSLIDAKSFFSAISELKNDFSLENAEMLTKFAIVGSKQTLEKAQEARKLVDSPTTSLMTLEANLINIEHFFESLPLLHNRKKELENDPNYQHKALENVDQNPLKKPLSEDMKFLLAKIAGVLKDRDVSVWDAILTTGVPINENAKVSIHDFKAVLRSLDLQLSLKEKLLLIGTFGDQKNLIDVQEFIKKVETRGLTEKAIKVLMEKLAVALFYNDMSLKRAFECFDLNKNGEISKNEFLFGMGQLDLGLSLFEITQVLSLMDMNKNEIIEKEEFLNTFQSYFEKLKIDPIKDFSMSLLAKIKSLLNVKGSDLLQCFIEYDRDSIGVVDLEGLKTVLNNFGLTKIKPYELTTLIRLYFEYEEVPLENNNKHKSNIKKTEKTEKTNKKSLQPTSPKKTNKSLLASKKSIYFTSSTLTERIDYRLFSKRILEIADKHSKSDFELSNELFRKVFRLFQLKSVNLFEAFVYFDVNVSFTLSKLELRLGLASLDLHLTEKDFNQLWNGFSKVKGLNLRFPEFMQRFVQAGALVLQKFEDFAEALLKKFIHTIQKLGNYEEAFKKLDRNLSGQISISEFKEALKRNFLGFTSQEAEILFKLLCSGSPFSNENKENEQQKMFGYKQFARLLSQYNPKSLQQAALARLQAITLDKKLNWKILIQKFMNNSNDPKAKNPNEILLSDLKKLIRSLKTGLSLEEIDYIINSFSEDPINLLEFERSRIEAHKTYEQKSVSSNHLINELLEKFRIVIERERLQIERLFFDFDQKQMGFLELADFNQMVLFLRIPTNKHQIKICFQAIDIQKKGFITLANFKAFLEEGMALSMKKTNNPNENPEFLKKKPFSGSEDPEFQRILEKIKENSQISFEITLKTLDFTARQPLNEKTLGKILMERGCVLPNIELLQIIRKLQKDFPEKKLTIQEFLDMAIREGLQIQDSITEPFGFSTQQANNSLYIPPQVTLGLEKLIKMLARLEITPLNFYKYLKKPQKPSLSKKDLLKSLQAMDLGLLKDDLLLIHQFFDEKGFGEISEDVFLEKLELIRSLKSRDFEGKNTNEEDIEKKLPNFASKQQALIVLQKISETLENRGFNRKQIKALFDKNSNGFVNREELLEGLKSLDLGIEIDKFRILLEFLDKRETGVIEVKDLILQLFESNPDKDLSNNFHETRIRALIANIVGFLRNKQKDHFFLTNLVNCEKLVRPNEAFQGLSRLKIGISEADFQGLLRENGIRLSEEEKSILLDYFKLRINPGFLDLESLYAILESTIYKENEKSPISQENIRESPDFEGEIYRKIADYLRKANLSLFQAFQCIDRDGSGLISHEEFKKFIRSIEGNEELSEKELGLLVSNFANPKPGHLSYIDFREKFLKAYNFESKDQENISKENTGFLSRKLKDLRIIDKNAILFLLKKFHEIGGIDKIWSSFDDRKRGIVDIEDFTHFLQKIKVFFNKGQVGFLFNFIDRDLDGIINFMEFLDFYKLNEKVSIFSNEELEKKERKTSIKQLEFEIFEHICRVLNQKEVSLFDIFKELDPLKKGFISPHQFVVLLNKMGVFLSSESSEEFLKILEFKSPEKIHFSDLELKFQSFGLKIVNPEKPASFDFLDVLLQTFAKKALKLEKPLGEYLTDFDENFDGFLSSREFFKALKLSQKFDDFTNYEFQRLAHIFATSSHRINESDVIEIAKIKTFIEENSKFPIKERDFFLNIESFSFLLNHFDGFNRITLILQELHGKLRNIQHFGFAMKLRGLKLIGNKWISNRILTISMGNIENTLNFSKNLIKSQVSTYINNESAIRLLNPIKDLSENLEFSDKQSIQNKQLLINQEKLRFFMDSSNFSIEINSKNKISAFFSHFNGFSFETSRKLDILQYPKETLNLICKDGRKYEDHLLNELRIQSFYTSKDRNQGFRNDFLPSIIGIYEKKLGLDSIEKELYVLFEKMPENEYFSLAEIINLTGGLLRVPFLSKTSAIGLILRLWGYELLEILNEFIDSGVLLPILKPENVLLSRNPLNKLKLSNIRGIGLINEQGIISKLPDLGLFSEKEPEKEAYFAPELIMRNPMENTHLLMSWSFASLLFEVIFGKSPNNFFTSVKILKEKGKRPAIPSDFAHFEVFSNEELREILKFDYDIEIKEKSPDFLVSAIEKKDFSGMFHDIFDRKFDEGLADILNIISLCLQFESTKRPSIKGLLRSPVFHQDKYLNTSARQFASNLHFFRSPSQNLKLKVLDPLKLLEQKCRKNKKIGDLSKEILEITEILMFSVFNAQKPNKKLDDLQKNVVSDLYKNDSSGNKRQYPWIPEEKRADIEENERKRKKLPNFGLIKFLFDNEILDLLIFVAFHNGNRDSRCFLALKDLFRLLFSEFSSYDSACSPFVDKVLISFTKLFIGEDSILISEEISLETHIKTPRNSMFRSLYWTSDLLLIFGTLYRESISESGVGKTRLPVLQDYLTYCEAQQRIIEFQPKEKIEGIEKMLSHRIPRGFDYYRDLFTNAENLKVLQEKSEGIKASSLRIVVSYLKGVLESGNTDKIKALLDSRTPVYLINALNVRDAHLRTDLLEVFYLLSKVFASKDQKNEKNKPEIEEVNRTFGIITHFLQNAEDRLDRTRFLDCANDYFSLNRRVIQDYCLKLAEIFETPAIISPLFSGLKNPSELQINKILILKIFFNLIQGPYAVIRNLTNGSLDVFPSVFKLLVNKKSLKKKDSNALIPEVLKIYFQIAETCRPEVLKILDDLPGIRALLREQDLEIPIQLSVLLLHNLAQDLKDFYHCRKNEISNEIKGEIIRRNRNIQGKDQFMFLEALARKIWNMNEKFLNWLKFYYLKKTTALIEAWKLAILYFELFQQIAEDFFIYGNISMKVQGILIEIANFPDKLSEIGLEFVLFNPDYEDLTMKSLQWMLGIIEKINIYHKDSDEEFVSKENNEEIKAIIAHKDLRPFARNLLNPVSQAFSRVFLRILERKNVKFDNILNKLHFTEFFLKFVKLQYHLIGSFIKNKTEDIHIIEDYVEEANIRLKIFDNLVSSNSQTLKRPIIETQFLQYLTSCLLLDSQCFDAQLFKSPMIFLAYREFPPLKNEGLTMLTSIIWNKEGNETLFKELMVGISHNNLIQKTFGEVKKLKTGTLWISGVFLFSVMIRSENEQLIYLMKHEGVMEYLMEEFERNSKLKAQFPDIYRYVKKK